MTNILEYTLLLQDKMSAGLKTIGVNSEMALDKFSELQQQANKVKNTFSQMGTSISSLRQKLDLLHKERDLIPLSNIKAIKTYNKEIQDLQKNIDKLSGSSNKSRNVMGSIGNIAGALGIGFGASQLMDFVKDSASKSMEFGATKKSFEVLTGSQTKGGALAEELNKLQQQTILGPEVFKAAQTMMSFGVAGDKVVGIEKELGDVSMGNKDKFEALTLAFSQTQAAGKLMGQDLLQYINAGFNPLQTMSERWKEFGLKQQTSVGQLKDMMEKGQISAAAVAKAFELATGSGGKFNNMMDTIANTTYGKAQILEGQWESFKIKVGDSLDGVTGKLMDMASATLDLLNPQQTATQQVQEQTEKIFGLYNQLTAVNTSETERKKLLDQLKEINPNITKGINDQAIEYGKLADNIQSVVSALGQKRIAEQIQNSGFQTISSYNKAVDARGNAGTQIAMAMAKAAALFPDIAARTDLTTGQKQSEYQNALKTRIGNGYDQKMDFSTGGLAAGGGGGTYHTSVEKELLNSLTNSIKNFNTQNSTVANLTPAYSQIQNDSKNALDLYNKMFGIAPPALPGATGKSKEQLLIGGGNGKKNGKATNDAIATGGTRNTTVNISIGKQVEKMVFEVADMKEGADKMRDRIVEELTRAVAMGASLGGAQ